MDDDTPPTPGQRKSEPRNPRFKKEGKGKQPANGKPSHKKSSKSKQDSRDSKSSPGMRGATVEGVQSTRPATESAKRSTTVEHDRSKRLSVSSEHSIFDSGIEHLRSTTYNQDHRQDQPFPHEEMQEIEVEEPVSSLQEGPALSSNVVPPPPPPYFSLTSVLMILERIFFGNVVVKIVHQDFPQRKGKILQFFRVRILMN